jgi:hypothetical protein
MNPPIADEAAAEIVKTTPVERQVESEILISKTTATETTAGTTGLRLPAWSARRTRGSGGWWCSPRATPAACSSCCNKILVFLISGGKRPLCCGTEP